MALQKEAQSKKAQIEALLFLGGDEKMSVAEIAKKVGTSASYVYKVIYFAGDSDCANERRKRNNEWNKAWRKRNPDKYKAQQRRHSKIGRKYDHHRYFRYTEYEDKLILGSFKGTDRELAKKINRSVNGLKSRRVFLRKKSKAIEKEV